jgi:hypothetical protein
VKNWELDVLTPFDDGWPETVHWYCALTPAVFEAWMITGLVELSGLGVNTARDTVHVGSVGTGVPLIVMVEVPIVVVPMRTVIVAGITPPSAVNWNVYVWPWSDVVMAEIVPTFVLAVNVDGDAVVEPCVSKKRSVHCATPEPRRLVGVQANVVLWATGVPYTTVTATGERLTPPAIDTRSCTLTGGSDVTVAVYVNVYWLPPFVVDRAETVPTVGVATRKVSIAADVRPESSYAEIVHVSVRPTSTFVLPRADTQETFDRDVGVPGTTDTDSGVAAAPRAERPRLAVVVVVTAGAA